MKHHYWASFAFLFLSFGLYAQVHTTASLDVGIGTTTPESKLHVLGTTTIGGSGSSTLIINDIPGAKYKINTGAYNLDFSQHNAISGLYESRLLLSNGGNVGIGTTTPQAKLHIQFYNGQNTSYGLNLTTPTFHTPQNAANSYFLRMQDEGAALPAFIVKGNGMVGIGTNDPQAMLSVNGEIFSRKVRVSQDNWPDYVFTNRYQLLPLSDLKDFIRKNGHLPDIPTAEKISKDGQDLGEMNRLLLQKVEELTLYILQQENRIKKMEEKLERVLTTL